MQSKAGPVVNNSRSTIYELWLELIGTYLICRLLASVCRKNPIWLDTSLDTSQDVARRYGTKWLATQRSESPNYLQGKPRFVSVLKVSGCQPQEENWALTETAAKRAAMKAIALNCMMGVGAIGFVRPIECLLYGSGLTSIVPSRLLTPAGTAFSHQLDY